MYSDKETVEEEIKELEEKISRLENNENEDEYEEMLNETCGPVKIGSLTYDAGQVLKDSVLLYSMP
jgi:hypothetical protein